MSETIELTREEYDQMVRDIASLKRNCRIIKHQAKHYAKNEENLKKNNKTLLREVGSLKVALGFSEAARKMLEKQIENLVAVFQVPIAKVRVSKKGTKPVVVVFWEDGTSEYVRCNPEDVFSVNTGVALCICKRFLMPDAYRRYIVKCDYQVEEDDKPRKKTAEQEEKKADKPGKLPSKAKPTKKPAPKKSTEKK